VAPVTVSGDVYVVEVGDVLDLVAAAADVDVDCLAAANNLDNPGRIFPGDQIVIDLTCPPYAGQAFVPEPREDAGFLGQGGGGTRQYIIRYGDVLDEIAAANDIDVECMARVSGIENPNRIRPGDVVVIDPTCPPYAGPAPLPTVAPPATPAPPPTAVPDEADDDEAAG
jgi:LysM repeat protein